ncbi:MAG: SDR family oxidoreductase [Clostridia bacterium]|nr:SDR family oxidoreductase [Clostridia bacterium]
MKIIITGTSSGIGRMAAVRFIEQDHFVYGIDSQDPSIDSPNYVHFKVDIRDALNLPEITDAGVLINNAGTQNSGADIEINLKGTINVTEKYIASNTCLTSVLFNASASSITGQEFPEYAASKAGVVGYMKNVAVRLAPRGVTVNALSFGGVYTESNDPVISDEESFKKIMAVTPMKKWMSEDEAADWIIFMTLVNRSMSGQNLLIDNGETNLNPTFVWKD